MAIQNSVAFRTAVAQARIAAFGPNARLQIWAGTRPATCAALDTGAILAELVLPTAAGTASAGIATMGGGTITGAILATGTPSYYRVKSSSGTTCHEQGSVGAYGSGADLELETMHYISGRQAQLGSWTKTEPGA